MLHPLAYGVTLTVLHRVQSGKDVLGKPLWTETETTYSGCGWWPGGVSRNIRASAEVSQSDWRNQVQSDAQAMFPDGAVIDANDRVRLPDGSLWEVNGEAAQWHSQLTNSTTGVLVSLNRVTG